MTIMDLQTVLKRFLMNWAGARYAFVIPRCGEFAGGAETLVRQLAEKLAASGEPIDVLTTCARDNRTWDNFFPKGETVENGVRVLRFPVSERNIDAWIPLQIQLSQGLRLTPEEELVWMENSVNSVDLYEYISENAARYRALIFAPYLFGTTFWGSLIHPANSILLPCLHDESYAYTSVFASMFRQVRGCIFNALPEKWLAEDLFGEIKGNEVGMGFEVPPIDGRNAGGLTPELPVLLKEKKYLLYVGRKETGKNLHLLVDYFVEGKVSGKVSQDLCLAILGGGSFDDLNREAAKKRSDIIDLPFVDEEIKREIIRNSVSLVQPSTNESFSIVLMEAWLQKIPVLVHARAAVTKHHVEESNGGLYFGSAEEFAEVVSLLQRDPALSATLGENGFEYVVTLYGWDAVLDRFHKTVDDILYLE